MKYTELISYNPADGLFTWSVSRGKAKKGDIAGRLTDDGYIRIGLYGRQYSAHRLAWEISTGVAPREEIEHINGNRSDNRIANLRETTAAQRGAKPRVMRKPRKPRPIYSKKLSSRSDLTLEMVMAQLEYNPETGVFYHTRNCRKRKRGDVAGATEPKDGYRVIGVRGHYYRAHRLAWLITYGEWPIDQIDHINGDPQDNRISNLRIANGSQNMWNSRTPKNNSSGVKGVSWSKKYKKWAASIKVRSQTKSLGMFENIVDAQEAYKAAAIKFHGEFARFE